MDTKKTEDYDYDAVSGSLIATGEAEACLVVIHGPQLGELIPLSGQELMIGRSDECGLRLTGSGVSRSHCRVARDVSRGYFVEDLGSTNGTLLNDERIDTAQLRDGDLLSIGDAVVKFFGDRNIEAIYHSRLHEQVNKDALTGLFNRRYFDSVLEVEIPRAARYRRPLALIIIDVDRFKSINDSYGHPAGDAVLSRVAALLLDRVRKSDVLFRVGGDELAVILPETSLVTAVQVAEACRRLIADATFELELTTLRVTASFGVAELQHGMEQPTELLQLADQSLYRAKAAGGNRVESLL